MLGEHRFHLFLWLAAAALSVSLGGLEYIPFLKEHPGSFIGFLILAVVLLLLGVGSALQGEARTPRPGHKRRMVSLLGMVICGLGFVAFAAAYFWPSGLQTDSPSAVAKLAELGWTVKPTLNGIQFEVANRALPPMDESAVYFAQLSKPFQLHFQQVPGLEGLHLLAGMAGCTKIEINAGEFTDISELRGFDHLDALTISQVPLSGMGTVDASALASLTNLRQLQLGAKVRDVGFLAALTHLKTLGIGSILVSDISPVSGLADLETLSISGPRITDLRPLSHNNNLRELTIGAPQIPGLIDLVHLKSLKKLSIIVEQQNFNLHAVGALTSLELLWIWVPDGGELDVAPLRSLANLRSLSLMGASFPYLLSSITSIEAIGGLTELRTLSISSFPVNNLAFVAKLMNLEELSIYQMPISSIEPVRDLKSLKKVSLNLTAVVDISPLLDLPALTELTVGRTPARSDLLAQLEQRGVKVNSY
jgi:hypothetical protein